MEKTKKYYLATLGCPKNEVDSEAIEMDLLGAGLVGAEDVDSADLVIINSCGFINDARVESLDTLFELHKSRKAGSILVLCGCLPARYNLKRSINEVDIFLPSDKHDRLIPRLRSRLAARYSRQSRQTEKTTVAVWIFEDFGRL